jgi:hypothetical protein
MHKLVSGLVALFASLSLLLTFGASPATAVAGDAGYSRYVTTKEFRNVKRGMTLSKVNAIFDIKGKTSYQGYGFKSREYRTRSKWGFVFIDFERRHGAWVLMSKSAYWG